MLSFVLKEKGEMTRRKIGLLLAGLLISASLGWVAGWSPEDKTPKMPKEELRLLLGSPEVVIVDVRLPEEWKKSDRKVQGAIYEDPETDIKKWADEYPRVKTLVFYCS